jgi:hypothetical protein
MTPRNPGPKAIDDSALPFDVTQEIDPALSDLLRQNSEPTLTQGDFNELAVDLPKKQR